VFICLAGDCPVFFAKKWGFCKVEFDGTIAPLKGKHLGSRLDYFRLKCII